MVILTFTAVWRHLSEGVVTAVTLAPDYTGLTLTLATLSLTGPGERANRIAVTQQACLTAGWVIVVIL